MLTARRRSSLLRWATWLTVVLAAACAESPPGTGDDPSTGGATPMAGSGGASTGGSPAGSGGTGGSGAAGASGTSATSGGTTGGGYATGGGAGTGAGGSGGIGGSATGGTTGGGAGTGGIEGAGTGGSSTSGGASGSGGDGGSSGAPLGGSAGQQPSESPRILVFSRTLGYRHESIPDGIAALSALAVERDWTLDATEDPAVFADAELAPYDVIVFLSSSGDVFDAAQEAAFERFIRTPSPRKGFVGIHAASTTEYDWPFYAGLIGAFFREHPPDLQSATVVVEAEHPSTATLPARWTRTEEWYAFRTNPRPDVTVLLSLDESTYTPGTAHMSGDHPVAWSHTYEGARVFYTSLGHTRESYSEPLFRDHLVGGIEWAAGR